MSALLFAVLAATPAAGLSTVAEKSGFTETGRYAEVEALCAALPKAYPGKVKCDRFGVTPLGRPMLVLAASADGALTPESAKARKRPVLFFQGGIHAGEIDGKDAGLVLLKELLEDKVLPGALAKVTVIFVPVLNVDGHERFGPNNRPNQIGPKEMGWRVTAQNLNLNRDYLKADAPEMVAELALLRAWDPILFADLHVTDGAKFQHDVSVTFEPQQQGPEALRVLGRALRVGLFAELEQGGHHPVDFYPSFVTEDEPTSGFTTGWPPPRFAHSYWAANGRFGVLVETHSWKDYATRVKTTADVCRALVRQAMGDGQRWLKAAQEADAVELKRAGQSVVLAYDHGKNTRPLEFLGYAYTVEKSDVSGKKWIRYDDTKPETWTVPFADELVPVVTVTAPKGGYLVPPQWADLVAAKLKVHGLSSTRVKTGKPQPAIERFHATDSKFRPLPFEGHMVVQLQGEWRAEEREVPAGSLFVPIAQPHASLVMHLLEPLGPDSLAAWGFFNAHLEQKEYLESYVAEAAARKMLEDPQVKAAFEAKLKDEAFAKNPDARLRFFAERHPAWDGELGVLPVWRTDVATW
jgi:hypothetical protein